MVRIKYVETDNQIWIKFKGHTVSDICAAISSIMYTTVNAIDKYNKEMLTYHDNKVEDEVEILIYKPDEIVLLLVHNMFDMLHDLYEDNNEDKIKFE